MRAPTPPLAETNVKKTTVGFVDKPIKTGKRSRRLSTSLKVLIGLALLSAGTVMVVSSIIWWYLSSFTQAAQISLDDFTSQIRSGLSSTLAATNDRTNILILGLDEIAGQKDSLLTDTILVASYSHQSHDLTLVSLPRDLWIAALKTKINALYYYGQLSSETTGPKLVSSIVAQVTGLPIHYSLVVNLNSLEHIINPLGGIDINVPTTFTDTRFPRGNVDIRTATSQAELYETVTFNQGNLHMDGVTALKYIRSRESSDTDQGNDLARQDRQRTLIMALIAKLSSSQSFKNPRTLGTLLYIYNHDFITNLGVSDLVALAKLNGTHLPKITSLEIPAELNGQRGLIFHPPTQKYQQWVFEPADPTWQEINQFISTHLSSN